MNTDQKLILDAYSDAIKKLYGALFDNYAQAGGDAAQQQEADHNFTAGLAVARKSRDRAIDLLA